MTADDLAQWLTRYGGAWVNRDPDEAAALFAETARYYELPFDPPLEGRAAIREYWTDVPRSQVSISFESDVLAVTGRGGIAHWRAAFTRIRSGQRVKLDGVFALEFDASGACTELREWWHRREGATMDADPARSDNG